MIAICGWDLSIANKEKCILKMLQLDLGLAEVCSLWTISSDALYSGQFIVSKNIIIRWVNMYTLAHNNSLFYVKSRCSWHLAMMISGLEIYFFHYAAVQNILRICPMWMQFLSSRKYIFDGSYWLIQKNHSQQDKAWFTISLATEHWKWSQNTTNSVMLSS